MRNIVKVLLNEGIEREDVVKICKYIKENYKVNESLEDTVPIEKYDKLHDIQQKEREEAAKREGRTDNEIHIKRISNSLKKHIDKNNENEENKSKKADIVGDITSTDLREYQGRGQ